MTIGIKDKLNDKKIISTKSFIICCAIGLIIIIIGIGLILSLIKQINLDYLIWGIIMIIIGIFVIWFGTIIAVWENEQKK